MKGVELRSSRPEQGIARRDFLKFGAAAVGGLAIAGPLQAFSARVAAGQTVAGEGYGPLVNMGDLWLPEGFEYRIISQRGWDMTDINPATGSPYPTPSKFDGMGAFAELDTGRTILIRNHENISRPGRPTAEIPVVVPDPYDETIDPITRVQGCKGGVTRLSVQDRQVLTATSLLGGTIVNCAGGETPWGSWITCEEAFDGDTPAVPVPHGYVFEVDASATAPVQARPIKQAGRFDHEAVVWHDEALYLTEDKGNACFYRYTPTPRPSNVGDLAGSDGPLDALVVEGYPNLLTGTQWPVPIGEPLSVSWVTVDEPDPISDDDPYGTRFQAQAGGAAIFQRTEGCWLGDDKIYFDCTNGGVARMGQIFELDPYAMQLTLVFESSAVTDLYQPDNLTVAPTDDLFICEDTSGGVAAGAVPHIRALTSDGLIYDFARAQTNRTEFCGACFSPVGPPKRGGGIDLSTLTLFVNQQGVASRSGAPGVTYAIWGPWKQD